MIGISTLHKYLIDWDIALMDSSESIVGYKGKKDVHKPNIQCYCSKDNLKHYSQHIVGGVRKF